MILGAALLEQAFNQLPPPLAYSIVGGWLAYIVAAILVFRRARVAYPLVMVLAVLTLVFSPQPEHYSLVNPGQAVAGATSLLGSATQISLIALIPIYSLKKMKKKEA